jgi:hypothetical protein
MKMKYGLAILLAHITALVAGFARAIAPKGVDALNISGTHAGADVTRSAEAAVTTANLLLRKGTGDGQVLIGTATAKPLGTAYDTAAADEVVGVCLLGGGATRLMVAAAAVTVDAPVYTAADGKVTPTAATGSWLVGYALTAASGDGKEFEVMTCVPSGPVYLHSTTTVAADALAIPVTHRTVAKTTGGDAEALTLADGLFLGQRLQIFLATDGGGDGTLTPTTKSGFSTIVFADKGDNVDLEWTTSGWIITGSAGVAAPPVISLT